MTTTEPHEHDEYELVPMNPIRRMERRLERLEKPGSTQDHTKELIEIVRTNQHVVDGIAKSNSEMLKRVDELTVKLGSIIEKLEGDTPTPEQPDKPVEVPETKIEERLEKMERRLNALIVAVMPRIQKRHAPPQQTQQRQYGSYVPAHA
ncbi:MAG: hypothetical protein ABIA21_02100 [Candidatus Aenigmatarchaeota archaeon]